MLALQSPTASYSLFDWVWPPLSIVKVTGEGKSLENACVLSGKKVKFSRLSLLRSVCYLDGMVAIVDVLEGKAHL